MDAIVIAGGVPTPVEPLYPYTQGKPKALLDLCGKPMIQWVLDALEGKPGAPLFSRSRPAPRVLGRYLDPATARYLEIVERGSGQAVSIYGSDPIDVEIQADGSLRGDSLTIARSSSRWPSIPRTAASPPRASCTPSRSPHAHAAWSRSTSRPAPATT